MRLIDLPRTTSFRTALSFLALFGVASLILFGFLYWRTSSYLMAEVDAELAAEERALTNAQPAEFRLRLEGRSARDPMGRRPFGAFTHDGNPIVGNLTQLPIADPPMDQAFSFIQMRNGLPVEFRGRAHQLPSGDVVVVSQEVTEQKEFHSVLGEAMISGGLLILVMGLAGAVIMGIASMRRLDGLTSAIQRIVSGGLVGRLPRTGTSDDIDRLVQVVNGMLDEIERLMHEVKGVCDGIAHDLRTPLTRLLAGLERARRRDASAEEYGVAVDDAIVEIRGLLQTFSAMLRISEIEDSARRAGFEDIDLVHIARDVIEFYEPAGEEKNIRLTLDLGGVETLHLPGDPNLLFEAVGNLVDNAIKFTPDGGAVTLTFTGQGLSVSDTGPGILPEDREAVLRRFHRVERSRHVPGNGLGLSLVAAIAHLHGLQLDIADARPGCRVSLLQG